MKLDDVICSIDRDISVQEKEISSLKNRKDKFQKIKNQYPDAQFENGVICLQNIWNTITCMRIERSHRYYTSSKISVKFLLGKNNLIEGMKIHTFPLQNPVAEIRRPYKNYTTASKEIIIFDYKKFIPLDCPKRNSFIKRIKLHLINTIMEEGLSISDSSFEKEEFTKLLLLK